jgi:uncharacterized protein (TIGR02271 family)
MRTGNVDVDELIRHEEEAVVDARPVDAGAVRVRKRVETEHWEDVVPRNVEYEEIERRPPTDGDSGEVEVLPDGSVSIPLLEEEIVVTKRLVVRERLIVRKATVVEEHRVETELRREHADVVEEPPA